MYPRELGCFLDFSIPKFDALGNQFNQLAAVRSLPVFLRLTGQFIDHHPRGPSRAASLGLAGVMPDGAKVGFNGVGGPDISPVGCWKIIERKQHIIIFFQALTGLGIFGLIQGYECRPGWR